MERMREALQQDDPELTVYGCSAQDLTSQKAMTHIVEVQKYFRNYRKPCAWLTGKAIVVKRFKQAILPEHIMAYKPHPEYQAKLSAVQTDVVNDFLVSKKKKKSQNL